MRAEDATTCTHARAAEITGGVRCAGCETEFSNGAAWYRTALLAGATKPTLSLRPDFFTS